jgi:transposase-like protein
VADDRQDADLAQDPTHIDLQELFRGAVRFVLELTLEEELRRMVGAPRYARAGRKDQRNGSYMRGLLTSLGHVEVKMPRSRSNGSPTHVLGAYQRRVGEIDAAITEAYVNGVSTRGMSDVTEALLGNGVGKSTVSRVTKRLEEAVEELRKKPLEKKYPYVYLDATFLDARWAKKVENVSALVAYGVNEDGHRELLTVTIGYSESEDSWSDLLRQLVDRGLSGVRLVISDDHAGLKAAVRKLLPEVPHQRCTVHFLRNIGSRLPQRLKKRVLREVSAMFSAASLKEAKKLKKEFDARWSKELPEAVECLNAGFAASTQFFAFPAKHRVRLRSTNGLERLHGEIKRRTRAVGAFPDRSSALRLVTAVALRVTEIWGARRYLDMSLLE